MNWRDFCFSVDTHRRSGVFAAAALAVGLALVSLALLVYKVTKRGTAGQFGQTFGAFVVLLDG